MSIDSPHALRVEVARLTKERDEARADAANLRFINDKAREALAAANARADAAEALAEDRRKARDIILGDVHELRESLAAARRDIDAHKEALSDLMKLINDGALVRNIGQDGEPGWTLRAMRLVMALKHAYALVPDLAAPASAPGEEGQ